MVNKMDKGVWIVVTIVVALIIGVLVVASTGTTIKGTTKKVIDKISSTLGGINVEYSGGGGAGGGGSNFWEGSMNIAKINLYNRGPKNG